VKRQHLYVLIRVCNCLNTIIPILYVYLRVGPLGIWGPGRPPLSPPLRAGAELTSLALAAYGTVVTLALTSDDDKLPLSAA